MKSLKVHFNSPGNSAPDNTPVAPEPSTCTDAEPFALRVLDDSMEPEFRKGCIILVDPTGVARDGAYVLARCVPEAALDSTAETDGYVFRQLRRFDTTWTLEPLNRTYLGEPTKTDLSEVVGVIVQRAGTRRRYHKRYD